MMLARLADTYEKSELQTLDRALRILELVCESEDGALLTPLSEESGLPKSTVHRLLAALIAHGLVEQDSDDRRYRPGLRMFEWSQMALRSLKIRDQAVPELRDLVGRFQETAHLAILDGGDVVYIDKEESPKTVRMFSEVGKRSPAHCTGVGKVLLAALSDEELDGFIRDKGLPRFTTATITEPADLREELERVRTRGYAIDDKEHEPEIRCVAAPVLDARGRVTAAISLTFPAHRATRRSLDERAPMVKECAIRISKKMGWTGDSLTPVPR